MSVVVLTDSASSLEVDAAQRLGIVVVPLQVVEGGVSLSETELDVRSLHRRIADGPLEGVTTSQPSPEQFGRAFREALQGHDVVGVFVSSKMSGTMRAAEQGLALALQEHPSARAVLIDSESNSMQEGFAVLAAAECAASGGDLEACAAAARGSIARSRYLFAPTGLDHLAHGGRISGAAALAGSILRIAPVLTASGGTTGVAGVVRSRRQALAKMAQLMRSDVERCGIRRAAVQAVSLFDEAEDFAREIVSPLAGMDVGVTPVAAAVAIHVGPAIGLAYETVEPLR